MNGDDFAKRRLEIPVARTGTIPKPATNLFGWHSPLPEFFFFPVHQFADGERLDRPIAPAPSPLRQVLFDRLDQPLHRRRG